MSIVIREKDSGTPLAEAEPGADVLPYEGNLYFDPGAVHQEVLRVTERTYTCPMKGTCHWVDFVGTDGRTVKAKVKVSKAARRAAGRGGLRAVATLAVRGVAPARAAVRLSPPGRTA